MAIPVCNQWKFEWLFNESSGSNIPDTGVNAPTYDGTTVNSPTWVSGKIGNALSCAGASSQYAGVGGLTNLDWESPFTWSFWFKTTEAGTKGLVSKANIANQGNMLFFVAGKIQYDIRVSTPVKLEALTNNTWNDGAWHHCYFAYNGNKLRSGVDLWIDGSDDEALGGVQNLTSWGLTITDDFRIARDGAGNYSTTVFDMFNYSESYLAASTYANDIYNSGSGVEICEMAGGSDDHIKRYYYR